MQNKWDPILAAAKRLFIDKGYAATSMDEVAAQSGATKRTVYNNFGSKEGLLEAVIDTSIAMFREAAPALPASPGHSDFAAYAETIIKMMTWRDAVGLQRFVVSQGTDFPELVERLISEATEAISRPVRQHLQSEGLTGDAARAGTARFIEQATSAARLDRLIGARPAYPDLETGFELDDKDRCAAASAARYISTLSP